MKNSIPVTKNTDLCEMCEHFKVCMYAEEYFRMLQKAEALLNLNFETSTMKKVPPFELKLECKNFKASKAFEQHFELIGIGGAV